MRSFKFLVLIFSLVIPNVLLAADVTNDGDYEDALEAFNRQEYNVAFIHLKNSLKNKPDNLPAKVLYARLLLENNNYPQAISEFKKVISLGADVNLIVKPLSLAYLFDRQYQEVIDLAKNWTLTNDNLFELRLLQASAHISLKQYSEAEAIYNELLLRYPLNTNVLNSNASLNILNQQYEKAAELVETSLALDSKNPATWHLKGRLAQAENKQQLAVQYFKQGLAVFPDDPLLQRSLVSAYMALQAFDDAEKLLSGIIESSPDDPHALLLMSSLMQRNGDNAKAKEIEADLINQLSLLPAQQYEEMIELKLVSGVVAYSQGDYESALKHLTHFLTKQPNNLKAISLLADVYIKTEQTQLALDLLEKKEKLIIENIELSLQLAQLYLNQGKYYKADYWLSQLRKEYPNNQAVILMSAKTLMARGKIELAVKMLKNVDASKNTPDILYNKAALLMQTQAYNDSLDISEQLLLIQPNNIDFLLLKAANLIKLRNLEQASDILDGVLLKHPNHFAAKFNKATLLNLQRNSLAAEKILIELIKERPEHVESQYLLSRVEADLGRFDSAIDRLNKVLIMAPNNLGAREFLVRLFIQTKQFSDAFYQIEKLDKAKPLNYGYLLTKSRLLIQLNQAKPAQEQLRILFGMSLDMPERLLEIGRLQIEVNDEGEAEKSFLQGLKIQSDNLFLNLELARLYLNSRQIDKLKQIIVRLNKSYATNPNVYLLQGDLAISQAEQQNAFDFYVKAVEQDNQFNLALIKLYHLALQGIGETQFESLMQNLLGQQSDSFIKRKLLADYYMNTQQWPLAQQAYETILQQSELADNYKPNILNNLANIYGQTDLEKGLETISKALLIEPKNAYALDTKGWLLIKNNDISTGLEFLRQSYTINSTDPVNLYHLGVGLSRLQRNKEALVMLNKAVKLSRNFAEIEQAKQLIQQLSE